MTTGYWTTYNHLPQIIGDGTVDLENDSFRVVLIDSGYTPDRSHTAWSDLSGDEHVTEYGYTQNGYGITQTWTQSGAISTFDSDDPTWTIVTAALSTRFAALIRDANGDGTLAAADLPMAYILLDDTPTDYTVHPGNDFILGINALGYFQIGDA